MLWPLAWILKPCLRRHTAREIRLLRRERDVLRRSTPVSGECSDQVRREIIAYMHLRQWSIARTAEEFHVPPENLKDWLKDVKYNPPSGA